MKSNLGNFPFLSTSILSFSFFPLGTSLWGIFGIFDKIFSNSFLITDCCSEIFSIVSEISFDLENKALSLVAILSTVEKFDKLYIKDPNFSNFTKEQKTEYTTKQNQRLIRWIFFQGYPVLI